MKRAGLWFLAAGVAAGVLFWTLGVRQAPGAGMTFLVSGDRVEQVPAGGRYVRMPGTRVVSLPDSGSLVFPTDPAYRLFSRDGAEVPATFDIDWRVRHPAAGLDFARTGRGSFQDFVVLAAFRSAARTAAAELDAQAIYDDGGRLLLEALSREVVLPRGVEAEVSLRSLVMSASAQQRIVSRRAEAAGRRVLFIGVDALDGRLVDAFAAEGRLPALQKLAGRGVRGDLKTLSPMLSPLIWTSMATGVGPERHGILDFVTTDPATGKQIPVTSRQRRAPAFWNIASFFDRSVNVVGWLATWPAEAINGRMVTDRFGFLAYAAGTASGPPTPDMVHPPAWLDSALAETVRPDGVSFEKISRFLDISRQEMAGAGAEGFRKGNLINNFVLSYATAESYRRIGVRLIRERPHLTAVYFEFLDAVCHLFMPYAPPRQPSVSEEDFDRYRDAVRLSYAEMDRILASLVNAAGDSTIIIVASDHGFLSGQLRPSGPAAIEGGQAGRWHRDPGVIVLAGPGVRRGAVIRGAHVLDVAPTLLHLTGLPVSEEMEGRVLVDALTEEELEARPVKRIGRYDLPVDVWAPPPLTPPPSESRTAPAAAGADSAKSLVNLGLVLEQKGEWRQAEALYRKAVAADPLDPNARNNLANVLQKTGRVDEAIRMFRELVGKHPDFKPAWQNLGICYLKKEDPAAAVPWFDRALLAEPGNLGALVNRGHAHLRLSHLEAAEADFRRALELSPEAANAHFGLGLAAARRKDWPAARRAFERTLQLDPGHSSARQNLGHLAGLEAAP